MKLVRVSYELFESDLEDIKNGKNSDYHEIDREMCLTFEDGQLIFVSWTWPPQYRVGYQRNRFCTEASNIKIDVSRWNIWGPLIGEVVLLEYLDPDFQILELKSSQASIYFSSQEKGNWFADVLHISTEKPSLL